MIICMYSIFNVSHYFYCKATADSKLSASYFGEQAKWIGDCS